MRPARALLAAALLAALAHVTALTAGRLAARAEARGLAANWR